MSTIQFLTGWAIRSSVLILLAAVLLRGLRVKDSSVRLAVWCAVLCASLAIPALTVSLPTVPVTVTHAPAAFERNVAEPVASNDVFRPVEAVPAAPFDWVRAAVMLYSLVAFALLLRLAVGLAMSWRLLAASSPTHMDGVRESERVTSPVTLGIVRPVIVLAVDWREWEASKLDAVLAHERSHIRRFDPAVQYVSALHRAALWFTPAVWFLHLRIVRVAEEASDDAAVGVVRDRASYAEILLEFMRRGACDAGVPMARYGKADARIHRILDGTGLSNGLTRRAVVAIVALGSPIAYVVAVAQPQSAASIHPLPVQVAAQTAPAPAVAAPPATRLAVAAKPVHPAGFLTFLGNVTAVTVTVRANVDGQLKSVSFKEGQLIQAGDSVAMVELTALEVQVMDAQFHLNQDQIKLEQAGQPGIRRQVEAEIQSDQEIEQRLERALNSGSKVSAPITGIAGLRLIEPGNAIHPGEAIVTITQVEPIAVIFTVPEDWLPGIRSRMAASGGLVVEAWNRDNSAKIATGRLTAIDNQIDDATGTVKLKATFENKDGALFPNQFVNVHLLTK